MRFLFLSLSFAPSPFLFPFLFSFPSLLLLLLPLLVLPPFLFLSREAFLLTRRGFFSRRCLSFALPPLFVQPPALFLLLLKPSSLLRRLLLGEPLRFFCRCGFDFTLPGLFFGRRCLGRPSFLLLSLDSPTLFLFRSRTCVFRFLFLLLLLHSLGETMHELTMRRTLFLTLDSVWDIHNRLRLIEFRMKRREQDHAAATRNGHRKISFLFFFFFLNYWLRRW